MKAVLSDIHGNLEAFQAVLRDLDEQGVEDVICLGDVVGYGPNPKECIDLAGRFGVTLEGNHEQALLARFEGTNFNARARDSIDWTRDALNPLSEEGEANRRRWDFLGALPETHREDNVLYVHGTPRDPIAEYLYPRDIYRPEKLEAILELIDWLCFCGHTHVPGIWTQDMIYLTPQEVNFRYHLVKKKTMVNVGSVGQPRDGDRRASYALFDGGRVVFRKVEYPAEVTARKISEIPQLDPYLAKRIMEGR